MPSRPAAASGEPNGRAAMGDASPPIGQLHVDHARMPTRRVARDAPPDVPLDRLAVVMAERLASGGAAKPAEITLHPAELGRLTFAVERVGDETILRLAVERPETADLVRRHLEQLERASPDGSVRIRFDGQGGPQADGGSASGAGASPGGRGHEAMARTSEAAGADDISSDGPPDAPRPTTIAGRLDLRL